MRTRVVWSDEEKDALARRYAQLRRNGVQPRLVAFEQAQTDVLPLERRRRIAALTQLPWLDAALGRLKPESPAAGPGEALPAATTVREVMVDELVAVLGDVVLRLLQDPRLQEAVGALLRPQSPTAPAPPPTSASVTSLPSRSLPRVLVAGLLPGQADDMRREFAARLDLRFWGTDEKLAELKARAATCTHAVLLTGFVSHSADRTLASAAAGRFTRLEGGLTRLRGLLTELAAGTPAKRPWRAAGAGAD